MKRITPESHGQSCIQSYIQSNRQSYKQTHRQAHRQNHRQTAGAMCIRACCMMLPLILLLTACGKDASGASSSTARQERAEEEERTREEDGQTRDDAGEREEAPGKDDAREESAVLEVPAYDAAGTVMVRNSYDGKTVCYYGGERYEMEGEEESKFYFRAIDATTIETTQGWYLFRDGQVTKIDTTESETVASSRDADSVMIYSNPVEGVDYTAFHEAFFIEGDRRIPLPACGEQYILYSGTFSPNGSYYLYSLADTKSKECILYLHDGTESKEITRGNEAIAAILISDDGQTIYYRTKGEDLVEKLHSVTPDGTTHLGTYNGAQQFTANRDATQLIYHDGDAWCLSIDGKEPVTLRGEYHYIQPAGTVFSRRYAGTDSFIHTLYYDDKAGTVCRINAAGEAEIVMRNVQGDHVLSFDGRTLLYQQDGVLYTLDALTKDAEPVRYTEEEMMYFHASPDTKLLCYVDDNGDLVMKRDGEEEIPVLEDIQQTAGYASVANPYFGSAVVFADTDSIYYLDDGTLRYTQNGADSGTVEGIEGDAVYLFAMPGYLSVYTDEQGLIRQYFSFDGTTFHEAMR